MHALFRRGLGQTEMEMIADPEWNALKMRAAKRWGVEVAFDNGDAWEHLRDGRTVILDNGDEVSLYCGWDQADGEEPTLFTGGISDIKLNENEWRLLGDALS